MGLSPSSPAASESPFAPAWGSKTNVPPAAIVRPASDIAPLVVTVNMPDSTTVPPKLLFVPLSIKFPGPVFVSIPPPEITPESVAPLVLSCSTVPLAPSVIARASE